MYVSSKLNHLYKTSKKLSFDDNSKIVFMSDCHRGDGSWKDNLARNRNIYFSALQYYYNNGFTYIELGDGDELWENRNFINILNAHEEIFKLLYKFHIDKRLYLIFGNHDIIKKDKKYMHKNELCISRHSYYKNLLHGKLLFDNIDVHEALVLKHIPSNSKILLIHGHQGDFINDRFWKFSRFAVRYIWSILEGSFGFKDPTSPAKNYSKKNFVEKQIIKWAKDNRCVIIAGHTHKPYFPMPNEVPYFNDGSCVHPYSVTSIEIEFDKICLVKWSISANSNGALFVDRKIIKGPEKLMDYFNFNKRKVTFLD
ncbi:serine/threonine protein phosphatase [Clostridium tetani]|nr:serine/threonine protein phosphatase [Clostridium tetani]